MLKFANPNLVSMKRLLHVCAAGCSSQPSERGDRLRVWGKRLSGFESIEELV
jgi:hypothetical protein